MMPGRAAGHVLGCPLGTPARALAPCAFGVTLFHGMTQAPPSKVALAKVDTNDFLTYEELIRKAELVARHLLRHGCRSGDVMAIFAPNSIEWMLMMVASLRLGIVPAGISHIESPVDLRHQLLLCDAKFVFTSVGRHLETTLEAVSGSAVRAIIVLNGGCEATEAAAAAAAAAADCILFSSFLSDDDGLPALPGFDELQLRPEEVAVVVFSSGTTGQEKAILLSHVNLQAQFVVATDEKIRKVTDNQIIFAPLCHLGGGVMTLYGLGSGYSTHLMTRFEIEPYLRTISEKKIESVAIVPSVALALAKADEVMLESFSLCSLKDILCGTSKLAGNAVHLLRKRFPGVVVRQGYGLTETTAACCSVPRFLDPDFAQAKSGSIGVPLFNVEIKVVDLDSGVSLGAGESGEILVRSPLVMKGYKTLNSSAITDANDSEGWLHTGDFGYHDDDGYLWIVDRITDMIKCGSHQVSPSELESILLSHSEVVDACVFGRGAEPAAWVATRKGSRVTEEELGAFVSGTVAQHKWLTGGITFVDSIPRSPNGKIMRRRIQQLANSSASHLHN